MASKRTDTAKASDDGAIAEVERVVADLLRREQGKSMFFVRDITKLRASLNAACKDQVWTVVELVFRQLVAVGAELLVRSRIELIELTEYPDSKKFGAEYPLVDATADRIARIGHYVMQAAAMYAKCHHLTVLARRPKDDPKLIDLDEARSKAAGKRRRADKGRSRKKTATRA